MAKFGLSQSIRRVEDQRLLTGQGCFTDDVQRPGQAEGYVLRSPHAHARIRRIDTSAAQAMPGVLGIWTGADLAAAGLGYLPCLTPVKSIPGRTSAETPRPALAIEVVRYVGDPVAFIVAETIEQARDAAEAIVVDYEPLPAVTDLSSATEPHQPQVWENAPNNIAFEWHAGDAAKAEQLMRQAAHITRLKVINNRVVVAAMEARAVLAEYDAGAERWTITTNTQGSWLVRNVLAQHIFKLPSDRFRVITPDVGGGFGMKLFVYPEHVLTAFAARALRRPVKWCSTRSEAFLSDTQGRANVTLGELALDAEGRFLALRTLNWADMGAYLSMYGPYIPTAAGTKVLASVYDFQAIHARVIGVLTHTVPVDAYRGAGRPESNYLLERLIDTAAREMGIDRIELRRRNMVPPSRMPYVSALGQRYDSGDFVRVMDTALAAIDWAGFPARRAEATRRGKRRGIGLSYYLEATGGGPTENASIRFSEDGFVDVYVGTQSSGQGHETAYAMLTSHELGIPIERIRIHQGDSDSLPDGGGTGGARSLYSEGQAILVTSARVIEKGRHAAAEYLEAAEADIEFNPQEGRFLVSGTDRSVGILELAAAQIARAKAGQTAILLDASETAEIKSHTFPNGCHIAEVEVDPETGAVSIARYVVADDVGHVLNPLIVRGQVHGGVTQGIGQALLEHVAFDRESGQLLTASFMDYALPRADDLPPFEVELVEVPCATNPLGVKGAGEAGAVGSPPAVINALVDALAEDGVHHLDMPATPEAVWRSLRQACAA